MLADLHQADDLFRETINLTEDAQAECLRMMGETIDFKAMLECLLKTWHPDLPDPFVRAIVFVVNMNRSRLKAH